MSDTAVGERAAIDLNSKYDLETGAIALTGVQALVRLPLVRAQLDRVAGLKTAGFISGYRGSPLGGYDMQLAAAKKRLDAYDIVVRPAVNEDMGATAVWGTQQVNLYPGARFDGVFGIWYGKAPGVDRTGDVFKHATMAGTSPNGGVLAVAGDDHGAKSSSLAAQSEYNFVDAEIPVFAPSSISDVLTFGVKAFDMSRFAGLWVAMTTVAEIMDSTATINVDHAHYAVTRPEGVILPPDGLHIRLTDTPLDKEIRHREFRMPAAMAFARANGFDKIVLDAPNARFGIVSAGKAYGNARQALVDLGIDVELARRLGIRFYKPGLVWPLEPHGARDFVSGLDEVLVIEERRDLIESQLKQICYALAERPVIVGKRDERGRVLLKDAGEIDAAQIARAIYSRIPEALRTPHMREHIAKLDGQGTPKAPLHERKPYFCSGCPHNTSTKLPEGSRALAGIGCHYMVQDMNRETTTFSQMGGEGVAWVGQAPFTDQPHVFANLGDGTYFHSGILAIRQAVAANVNITYKILFNDAVAMTGGQHVDGTLTVPLLAQQLAAEGVRTIVVVSDDPERTMAQGAFARDIGFHHRDDLDAVQRSLRETPGVSALIYDQTCATELRRRRKRGRAVDPDMRLVINPRVCEGCGDCTTASNCLSVEPLATEYGVKRRINQSSCNADFSCLKGFCPSFVTVRGGKAQARGVKLDGLLGGVKKRSAPALGDAPTNIVLAGVGGQGVTTLAAIIDMAAHLDGAAANSVDMMGMAQKGGGVFVHIRLARNKDEVPSPRVGKQQADLVLANDIVVAHGPDVLPLLAVERTHVVLNTTFAPTAEFIAERDIAFDIAAMRERLEGGAQAVTPLEAGGIANALMGDELYANMIMLGMAWQKGLVPISLQSFDKAIELNGSAVAKNKQAFALGRLIADDPAAIADHVPRVAPPSDKFEDVLARRTGELIVYQDAAYAARYRDAIERIAASEERAQPGSRRVSRAAAGSLFKLMAYKDEYEVARLQADPAFRRTIEAQFGREARVSLNFAPPVLAEMDPVTGAPRKREFGPWMLRLMPLLASFKGLRGTPLDLFANSEDRKLERALRDEFFVVLGEVEQALGRADADTLVQLALLPNRVRGYGHVKAASVAAYREQLAQLRALIAPH